MNQNVNEDETIPVDIEPTQASSGDLNTDTSAPLIGNTTNGSFNADIPIGSSFMSSIEDANSPVELPQIQQLNANNIPSADTDITVSSDPNELVQAMYEGDPVRTEEYIEQNPEESIDILKDGTAIDTEARQVIDGNPRNVEVKDEAVEEALKNPGSFINSDKIGLLYSNDEFNTPLVSGYKREGDKLLDDYGNELSDYEPIDTDGGVLTERDEDFAGPDEYVDEASGEIKSLEDRQLPSLNQQDYHKDLALNGERGLETAEDVDFTVEGESDFVPTVYTIEDLDREIEEAEQLPVTNAEEAKTKQNKLKELRSKRVAYGNASSSDTNWNYDKSTATGGRASPRAGISNIGGGASGHGSMASTRPIKAQGDSHNSIASKAPLPVALEDNQGRVVSVNGKATTAPNSNNNGAFRSGSFGLMSKAKPNLKSVPSKAPVSSGIEHKGQNMMANNTDFNLEDGKQILIERLKQLLTQLTDEEKKEMGFSQASNQWNGKALVKLDGYTLQDLIDKVEEYLGGN